MTVIHELREPLWVQTPLGEGRARIMIDYGEDHNPIFIVHLNDGRIRCVDMIDLAGCENATFGIKRPDQPKKPS